VLNPKNVYRIYLTKSSKVSGIEMPHVSSAIRLTPAELVVYIDSIGISFFNSRLRDVI
jgi:hypothetical protein